MMDMNFLTPSFRLKLLQKQMAKIAGFFLSIAIAVIVVIYFMLSVTIKTYDIKIAQKQKEIKEIQEEIKRIKQETEDFKIEKLRSKIAMIEDLFTKKEQRFSSILYNIKENTPKKIWYKSLTYKTNVITLEGTAAHRRGVETAEMVILNMERELVKRTTKHDKEAPIYTAVGAEYIIDSEILGNDVNDFKYILQLYTTSHNQIGRASCRERV